MITKKRLAIELSKLRTFKKPKLELEQYPTDPDLASEILWTAYLKGDIKNKVIVDLGAGTGILGIGALILGAKKVYFVEIDPDAIEILKGNLSKFEFNNYEILNIDISEFNEKVDTVVMNPPFGVQKRKLLFKFLDKATEISNVIYSIHDLAKKKLILEYFKERRFRIDILKEVKFPIKAIYWFHEKRIERIDAFWIRAIRDLLQKL